MIIIKFDNIPTK